MELAHYYNDYNQLIGHSASDVIAWLAATPGYRGSLWMNYADGGSDVDVTDLFGPNPPERVPLWQRDGRGNLYATASISHASFIGRPDEIDGRKSLGFGPVTVRPLRTPGNVPVDTRPNELIEVEMPPTRFIDTDLAAGLGFLIAVMLVLAGIVLALNH